MANKPQKGKLTIEFHAEKLEALDYCMREKGMDLSQAVTDFVSGLYEKSVPKIMRGFLEPAKENSRKEENHAEIYS